MKKNQDGTWWCCASGGLGCEDQRVTQNGHSFLFPLLLMTEERCRSHLRPCTPDPISSVACSLLATSCVTKSEGDLQRLSLCVCSYRHVRGGEEGWMEFCAGCNTEHRPTRAHTNVQENDERDPPFGLPLPLLLRHGNGHGQSTRRAQGGNRRRSHRHTHTKETARKIRRI